MATLIREAEARDVLARLVSAPPQTKDDVRRVMATRRLENLTRERKTLRMVEARAIRLIRKVDYRKPLAPRLVFVAPEERLLWTYYRHVLSSAPWTARPFRALYLFCVDAHSGGVLGIVDLGADLHVLGPRDRWIGWDRAQKFRRLRNSINAGTLVGVAPFGWLTGGKFLLEACATGFIADTWRRRYGDMVALVLTTSLYGRSSVYNRCPSFTYLGDTPGVGVFHIGDRDWHTLRDFLDANQIPQRAAGVSANRHNGLLKAAAVLGVDLESVASHQPRGVYVSVPNSEARAFLAGTCATLTTSYTRSVDAVAEWWNTRWWAMRHPKLLDELTNWDADVLRVDRQIAICERSATGGTAGPPAGDRFESDPLAPPSA